MQNAYFSIQRLARRGGFGWAYSSRLVALVRPGRPLIPSGLSVYL